MPWFQINTAIKIETSTDEPPTEAQVLSAFSAINNEYRAYILSGYFLEGVEGCDDIMVADTESTIEIIPDQGD